MGRCDDRTPRRDPGGGPPHAHVRLHPAPHATTPRGRAGGGHVHPADAAAENAFLRGLVADLRVQVEEQGTLMDDMAEGLRRKAPPTTCEGATQTPTPAQAEGEKGGGCGNARPEEASARVQQLACVARRAQEEVVRLRERVAILEEDAAAATEGRLLSEARLSDVCADNDRLRQNLADLLGEHEMVQRELRDEREGWAAHMAACGAYPPGMPLASQQENLTTQLSHALARLTRDLNRSEKNSLKDRASYLGESKAISTELQRIAETSSELLSHVRQLALAASYTVREHTATIPPAADVAADGAASAEAATADPDPAANVTATPGPPALHTSVEEWEAVEKELRTFTIAAPEHITRGTNNETVKTAYLSRLSKVIEGYVTHGEEGRAVDGADGGVDGGGPASMPGAGIAKIDVAALRRESERITRELQLEFRIGLPHQLRLMACVGGALRMAFAEVASASEVFGIQSRAIASVREELRAGRDAVGLLKEELKRVTHELGTANHAAGVASVELNVAGLTEEVARLTKELRDVHAENTRIKQFMAKLKLSHVMRLQQGAGSPLGSATSSPARSGAPGRRSPAPRSDSPASMHTLPRAAIP